MTIESMHGLVDAFADGELPPAEAEAFRGHLVDCVECQRALRDIMMLTALTQTHAAALAPAATSAPPAATRPPPSEGAAVIPLASRRRRVILITMSTLAAAAAVVVLWRSSRPEPIVLAQADRRTLEPRLSDPSADHHRPYDVMRAAGVAHEEIPVDTLARLEKRGQLRALADGYLLSGEPERAAELLARAGESAEVESDRAALALQQRDPQAALAHAARALTLAPGQPQARWNRALALRDLGLTVSAAEAFEAVARGGEAGWADEARARAAALRAVEAERERSWGAADAAGRAMIATGAVPAAELVRAHPGLMHRDLYEALRASGDARRTLGLLPVATAIDAAEGSGRLVARVKAAAAETRAHAALAATYARLAANPAALTPAAAAAYLATLARAHDDDRTFGALVLLGHAGSARAELRRIADASGDPWLVSVADEADGEAGGVVDRASGPPPSLVEADRRCLAAHLDFRCAHLEYALALRSPPEQAEAVAQSALARARVAGVDPRELPRRLLILLGDLARARGAAALADAYVAEARLHMP